MAEQKRHQGCAAGAFFGKASSQRLLPPKIDASQKVYIMANVRTHKGITPQFGESSWVDDSAVVIGDVVTGEDCSVWPMTVIRGDMHKIRIGSRCSIQDGSVLHITHASDYNPGGWPLIIGDDVTVGHKALLHGCTIGSRVLVGMGCTVMDGAVVEDDVIIAAGTLVPPGKRLESGYLYVGSPCKQARELTDKEKTFFTYTAANYVKLKNEYLNGQ